MGLKNFGLKDYADKQAGEFEKEKTRAKTEIKEPLKDTPFVAEENPKEPEVKKVKDEEGSATVGEETPVFSKEKEEQIINSKIREIDVLSVTGQNLGDTRGRKGKKLPQISFRFSEVNDQYIRYISRIEGMSITEYLNHLVDKDREARTGNRG